MEYIQIALKYSSGNFGEAVNGFRSPLFSILLVPFIKLGIEPLFSTKILNIVLGFILLIILRKTAILLKIEENIRIIILFFSIPMLMLCIFSFMTPDLMSAIFIIMAFNILIDENLDNKKLKGIYFGMVIGFGYLSKAFNLFFLSFIFTLIVLIDLFVRKEKRKENLILYGIAAGVALIISVPWIILLSLKYHKFTISTAGNLSYLFLGQSFQEADVVSHLHPINSKSGFILDDSSIIISNFKNWFDLKFLIKNLITNVRAVFQSLDRLKLSLFSLIFLVIYKRKDYFNSFKIYSFFIFYILGYCLFLYTDRFFYPLFFLGFFICVSILLSFKKNYYKFSLSLLMLFIIYSFLVFPINYIRGSILSRPGSQYYTMGQEVQKMGIKGNVAGSRSGKLVMYITYYNRENLRYFGTTKIEKELKEYDIDYYFVWKDDLELIEQIGLNKNNIIGKTGDFFIYKLKN